MKERDEQAMQFGDELDNLINRVRAEYDMSYAQIVGVLQMKVWLLCQEADGRIDEL